MSPHTTEPEQDVDAYVVVGAHWPYDGPYDPHRTGQAALAIARLVRYLNNATGKPDALPYAAPAAAVVARLADAVYGLDQLLGQLAEFAEQLADDPTLYDDRRDRPGAETALAFAGELEHARAVAVQLADRLSAANRHGYHLGNDG